MWYNSVIAWLLRSPMHGCISKSFMLVTVTGRISGKVFTTSVNYSREGNTLTVISQRDRSWWRNLRGAKPVTICLQGQNLPGTGTVIEDDAGVTSGLTTYFNKNPQLAKYFRVLLDTNGQPLSKDIALAARTRVVIEIELG